MTLSPETLAEMKAAAEAARRASLDGWYEEIDLWHLWPKEDTQFVAIASPANVLALIAEAERVSALEDAALAGEPSRALSTTTGRPNSTWASGGARMSGARIAAPRRPTEAEFQRQIVDLAAFFGWRWVHFRAQKTETGWHVGYEGDPGWPDLFLAREGVVLAWELKRDAKAAYQPGQREWIEAMGAIARIVTPDDFDWCRAQLTAPRGKR